MQIEPSAFDYFNNFLKRYDTTSEQNMKINNQYYQNSNVINLKDREQTRYDDQENMIGRTTQPCGIANYHNSCYFNVVIQLLFQLRPFRKFVYSLPSNSSKIIEDLQIFFYQMENGHLKYVNPSPLLKQLVQKYPGNIEFGANNGIMETLSLMVHQILNQDSGRIIIGQNSLTFLSKISMEKFTYRNLQAADQNFENAYKKLQKKTIQNFKDSKGNFKDVEVTLRMSVPPQILIFNINRIVYVSEGVAKLNLQQFTYPSSIRFVNGHNITNTQLNENETIIKKLILENNDLQTLITRTQQYCQSIKNISHHWAIQKLKLEKQSIQKYYSKKQINNKTIQQLKKKIGALQESQTMIDYYIWGVIIRLGNQPFKGHFFLCLKNSNDKWFSYNDIEITQIKQSQIQEYTKKGQVSAIIYKKKNYKKQKLEISFIKNTNIEEIKKKMSQSEKKIFRKIDEKIMLKFFLKEQEIIKHEYQNLAKNNEMRFRYLYYFNPAIPLIVQKKQTKEQSYKLLLYLRIASQEFQKLFNHKFLYYKTFLVPPIQSIMKVKSYSIKYTKFNDFVKLQANGQIINAYNKFKEIVQENHSKIEQSEKIYFKCINQIIIMKGIYYLQVFGYWQMSSEYQNLLKIIENIFTLYKLQFYKQIFTKIKQIYNQISQKITRNHLIERIQPIQGKIISQIFQNRFKIWIERHQKVDKSNDPDSHSDSYIRQDQHLIQSICFSDKNMNPEKFTT